MEGGYLENWEGSRAKVSMMMMLKRSEISAKCLVVYRIPLDLMRDRKLEDVSEEHRYRESNPLG